MSVTRCWLTTKHIKLSLFFKILSHLFTESKSLTRFLTDLQKKPNVKVRACFSTMTSSSLKRRGSNRLCCANRRCLSECIQWTRFCLVIVQYEAGNMRAVRVTYLHNSDTRSTPNTAPADGTQSGNSPPAAEPTPVEPWRRRQSSFLSHVDSFHMWRFRRADDTSRQLHTW